MIESVLGKSVAANLSTGGTVDGDLTITGDLGVAGDVSINLTSVVSNSTIIDATGTEAFLVRKNSDGGDVFVVDSTNTRVGIGDSTPDNTLSIYGGNKQIRMGATDSNYLLIGRNSSTGHFEMGRTCTGAADEIFFRANEASGGNISFPTGNVGIGTSDPTSDLDIGASGGGDLTLSRTGDSNITDGSNLGVIYFKGHDDSGSNVQPATGAKIVGQSAGHWDQDDVDDAPTELQFWTCNASGGTSIAQRMVIDADGNVGIGLSTLDTPLDITPRLQVEGLNASTSSISLFRNSNDAHPPYLLLGKSRGTAVNADTVIQDNDVLGKIAFVGADGTDRHNSGAEIFARINGTPGGNDLPTELVFGTTADGGTTPTERMSIDASGTVMIDQNANAIALNIDHEGTNQQAINVSATNTSGDAVNIDADSLTTANALRVASNSSDTNTRNVMLVHNDNTSATGTTGLMVTQDAAQQAVKIDQNGNGDGLLISTDATTRHGLYVDGSSFTTGNGMYMYSNASNTSTRNLMFIHNDHASATGATVLKVVQDSSGYGMHISNPTNTTNFGNGLIIASQDENTTSYPLFIKTNSSDADETAGNTRFVVRADGNIGIGCVPDAKLHIFEDLNDAATSAPTASESYQLFINGAAGSTGDTVGIALGTTDGNDNVSASMIAIDAGSAGIADLAFYTKSASNTAERMRITAGGAVGINETVPLGTLHVKSADSGISTLDGSGDELVIEGSGHAGISILAGASSSAGIYFPDSSDANRGFVRYYHDTDSMKFRTNNSDAVTIDSSGNVGIGTAAPASSLHIVGGNLLIADGEADDAIKQGRIGSEHYDVDEEPFYYLYSIIQNGNNQINIGGGTSSGNAANLIKFYTAANSTTTAGTSVMTLDSNSRISLSNNGGEATNTIFGYQAGNSIHASSGMNTFIGHQVADATMTADADENTAVGHLALSGLTQGYKNTVIGSYAGINITTGDENVMVGRSAGNAFNSSYVVAIGTLSCGSITDANADGAVGVGHQALTALTTGAKNTAVGYNSASALLQGNRNTSLGYDSMNALAGDDGNNGGSDNVAIGVDAMGSLNAGVHNDARANMNIAIGNSAFLAGSMADSGTSVSQGNVCIGHEAAMTTGTNPHTGITAVGHRALKALTSGARNTAVGYEAADGLTVGEDNVAFGYGALGGASTSSENKRNVAIGSSAMSGTNAGAAQNIAIGYAALDGNLTSAADDNTAVGYYSLSAITSGTRNTAIGTNTGSNSTDVDKTVLIGYNAGAGGNMTSDADGTIAIGEHAGYALTSGIGNVAVGFQTLFTEDDGDYSTAVGHQALTAQTGTTGEVANTAVGYQSGLAMTKGRYTTAIGFQALKSEDVGDWSTALGYAALYAQNSDSDNETTGNTGLGAYTGLYNVTGQNNTYVGYQAGTGASGQSNSYNTALGANAMKVVTTGGENVGIGATALEALTDGETNTAVGVRAGLVLTTGDKNVFIGKDAADSATACSSVIAIGHDAMHTASTSTDIDGTVAIGESALASLTTGAGNTAIGYQCLDATDDGGLNTAVGYQSLSANCGNANTALGYKAGANVTGTTNTIIGHQAGFDTVALTSGTNNVIIGDNARTSAADSTNQVVIGRDAQGVRDNSVTLGNTSVKSILIPEQCVIGGSSYTTMADDATITVIDNGAGACMVYVYDGSSGGGGVFFCTYTDAAVKVAGSSNTAATDSDGNLCVYKSTSSHDIIVKNRLGASRNISIIVVGAQPSP